MMETVHCHGNAQRSGEGGSPERVQTIEDHSGVSVLKKERLGETCIGRFCTLRSRSLKIRTDGFPPLKGTYIGGDARML